MRSGRSAHNQDRVQGEDRARNGRLLGIIGLAVSTVLLALFLLSFLLRSG